MGVFDSFKRANEVIEQARRDVAKPQRDDLAARRQQKNQGGKR
ncbi:hypothetical protein [Streptomyces sp.]